jgi:prepilin-type processing-associated H-X9-DG protein
MAIVALLVSLLMPAIENSREAARKLSCQSNQKQIGLAVPNFADAQNRLPNLDVLPLTSLPGGLSISSDISIQALLLPYLDQASIYRQIRFDEYQLGFSANGVSSKLNSSLLKTPVPLFQCPSDGVPAGGCSYVFSCGTSPGLHENLNLPANEAASRGYVGRRMSQYASLSDGLSQTVILSERLVGGRILQRYTPSRDHAFYPAFNGFSAETAARSCTGVTDPPVGHFSYVGTCWLAMGYGYTWYNHVLTPNSQIPDCSDHRALGGNTHGCHTARSAHSGGVNAAFGDGSVRFISSEIDTNVWRALGTSGGNEVNAAGGL